MFTRFSSAIVLSPSVCIEVLQKMVIQLFCWDEGKQLASFRVTFSLPADRSHDILKTRRLVFKRLGFGRGTMLVIIKPMEKKKYFLIKVSVVTQLREMCIVGNFFIIGYLRSYALVLIFICLKPLVSWWSINQRGYLFVAWALFIFWSGIDSVN